MSDLAGLLVDLGMVAQVAPAGTCNPLITHGEDDDGGGASRHTASFVTPPPHATRRGPSRDERRRQRYAFRDDARRLYPSEVHDQAWAAAPGRHSWTRGASCPGCGRDREAAKGTRCEGQRRRPDGKAYRGRFSSCGYVARGGSVSVHAEGGGAWFGGLATCGSVHACPVCAATSFPTVLSAASSRVLKD